MHIVFFSISIKNFEMLLSPSAYYMIKFHYALTNGMICYKPNSWKVNCLYHKVMDQSNTIFFFFFEKKDQTNTYVKDAGWY